VRERGARRNTKGVGGLCATGKLGACSTFGLFFMTGVGGKGRLEWNALFFVFDGLGGVGDGGGEA